MPRMTAALAALVAVFCFAMVARGNPQRIAVLQADDELLRAVSLALGPWGLQTIAIDAPLPPASQPEAVEAASRLAPELDVEAVVWVTRLERGSLLWVYDVRTGDVTTRLLSESPPFDSAAAAAVALTVKTVLRASAVAPPEERFGAQTAPPEERFSAQTAPPEAAHLSALELGGGGHWVSGGQLDFRISLGALLWLEARRRFGLSLEVASGPGISIDDSDYNGRYRELVLGGKVRLRLVDAPALSVLLALGGAAHFANLEGTLAGGLGDSDVKRVNASIDAEARVNFHVSNRVYFGIGLGAAYFPSYRRYLVRGRPVLSPWPLTPSLTGYCGVELF